MITELLETAINEVMMSNFEITEFQLGEHPMQLFIQECKNSIGIPVSADINTITKYKGIRIREHPSKDAVMYAIKAKIINNITPTGE